MCWSSWISISTIWKRCLGMRKHFSRPRVTPKKTAACAMLWIPWWMRWSKVLLVANLKWDVFRPLLMHTGVRIEISRRA